MTAHCLRNPDLLLILIFVDVDVWWLWSLGFLQLSLAFENKTSQLVRNFEGVKDHLNCCHCGEDISVLSFVLNWWPRAKIFAGLEFQLELHFHHIIFSIQSTESNYRFFIVVCNSNEFLVVFSQLEFIYNVPLCNVSMLKIAYHMYKHLEIIEWIHWHYFTLVIEVDLWYKNFLNSAIYF